MNLHFEWQHCLSMPHPRTTASSILIISFGHSARVHEWQQPGILFFETRLGCLVASDVTRIKRGHLTGLLLVKFRSQQ